MEDAAKGLIAMTNLLCKGQGALCKAFYQKYGREALPIINGVMSQGGVEWGKIMQRTIPFKSMQAIAEQSKAMDAMMGLGMEMVNVSDNMLHFKISKCPFGLEGASRELCEAAMAMDEKRFGVFFGQGIDMKILKTVAAGDRQCELVFAKK